MKKIILLSTMSLFFISCNSQTDLMKLELNEEIENVVYINDTKEIGVETVEYPFCLLIEINNSSKYNFDGIDLKGQKIFFQVNSEVLKTDSITKFGGGNVNLQLYKDNNELRDILKKYKADTKIYGFRIELKTKKLKKDILKKVVNKYGNGIKNPNTPNGLYWNLRNEHKFIFYAPDYNRLTILNNLNLSKTCYWDTMNGLLDFGGCNNEVFMNDLIRNSKNIKNENNNKPILKIDKDWNINGFLLGKTNEAIFIKSNLTSKLEKTISFEDKMAEIIYENKINKIYYYFLSNENETENQNKNIAKGYSILDFNIVELNFDNGMKINSTKDEILKLINKAQIENYNDLKFSNYIEIRNDVYKINLNFDKNNLFSGIYVTKK